jgi:hypothetical protein
LNCQIEERNEKVEERTKQKKKGKTHVDKTRKVKETNLKVVIQYLSDKVRKTNVPLHTNHHLIRWCELKEVP